MARLGRSRLQAMGLRDTHEVARPHPGGVVGGVGRSTRTCVGAATTGRRGAADQRRPSPRSPSGSPDRPSAVVRNARRTLPPLGQPSRAGAGRSTTWNAPRSGPHRSPPRPADGLGRDNTAGRDPAGVAARSRRPTDRQGTPRQTRRVRLQGPDRRQRRRCHRRSQRRARQPARRADAGAGDRTHQAAHRARPRAVTADRGYGEAGVEDDLRAAGVRYVVLPPKANPTRRAARSNTGGRSARLVRWRTGCEGRISCAKRDFGLHRTRITGSPAPEPGAATASSPTTSSRSQRSPTTPDRHPHPTDADQGRPAATRGRDPRTARTPRHAHRHHLLLQGEVATST